MKRGLQQSAEMVRSSLLEILRARFPGPLPPEALAAVEGQTDLATLTRWITVAGTAASVEQFQAATRPSAGEGS